jgi:hypothetical protein
MELICLLSICQLCCSAFSLVPKVTVGRGTSASFESIFTTHEIFSLQVSIPF